MRDLDINGKTSNFETHFAKKITDCTSIDQFRYPGSYCLQKYRVIHSEDDRRKYVATT
jgi:hypothetical protein